MQFIHTHKDAAYAYEFHYADKHNKKPLALHKPVFDTTQPTTRKSNRLSSDTTHYQLTFHIPWHTPTGDGGGGGGGGAALRFACENRVMGVPLPFYEHILSRFGEGACVLLMHNGLIRCMARVCVVGDCTGGATCKCTTVCTSYGVDERTCCQSEAVMPLCSYLRLDGQQSGAPQGLLSMYEMHELVTMQLSVATTRRLIEVYGVVLRTTTDHPWNVAAYAMATRPHVDNDDGNDHVGDPNTLVVCVDGVYASYHAPPAIHANLSLVRAQNKHCVVVTARNFEPASPDGAHAGMALLQRAVFSDEGVALECSRETLLLTRNKVLSRIYACAHTWRISFICELCAREVFDSVAARGEGGLPREVCIVCIYETTRARVVSA